ncbi:hypothetical protein [Blastococcus sp. CT_GayMR16]|uniref:hypothetical protein n=1 Tax=Blastococcus sp. CT_GayMR16 TaxID=2559607 RepID=UPI001073C7B9|nr:hypothetical protein [Blastococcus sp. CT_GayMR16]TFV86954.1 hypothetical protein E4P38_15015 [Blastococcus sp. CT_GayMR16]
MELELRFDGLSEDVVDAQVDVQVLDLGMADAPADSAVAHVPSFSVSPARPSVRVTVDLPAAEGAYEPGLLVRVRGRTARDERVEFFNTSTTPLTTRPDRPVQVVLSRIT